MEMSKMLTDLANFHESFWSASQNTASTFVAGIWQGAAIALGLAICLKLAPRTSAALRFTIWMSGFAVVAALPFLPVIRLFPAHLAVESAVAASVSTSHPWLVLDARWSLAIAGLWLAASLYRAIDLAVHVVRLRGLWKRAIPVFEKALPLEVSRRFQDDRKVELCTTAELERPSIIGFFAPKILIPDWLMEQLTAAELDQIVLHETEHLRRGDDWTNLLQKLALVLFPLNPVLIWMERQLCLEREMACDEGVVRRTHAPRAYAACLTSLAERGLEHRVRAVSIGALSLGAWQRRPELVRRVHSILLRRQALGPWSTRGLLTVMGCGLLFGSVELARCPQVVGFVSPEPAALIEAATTPSSPEPAFQQIGLSTPNGHNSNRVESASIHKPALVAVSAKRANPKCAKSKSATGDEAFELSAVSPQQTLVKFIESDPAVATAQGWILLTTWQQQSIVSSTDAPPLSDFGDNVMPVQSGRLVVQVVPKNFVFPALAAVPTRNGWFIIQL